MKTAVTPKEKWAEAIWNKKNEVRIAKGEEPKTDELDRSYFIHENSRRDTKIADLERWYNSLKKELAAIDLKKKVDAYWAGEGASRKAQLESDRESLKELVKSERKLYKERIDDILYGILGEGWKMAAHSNESYIEIGMVDTEKPDYFVFGNTIDIHHDPKHWVGIEDHKPVYEEEFTFNVGSTGSFPVLKEDADRRAEFYTALGKLISERMALEGIKSEMGRFRAVIENIYEKRVAIDKELENPLETEKA